MPYIGIANLLLGRALHQEYIQGTANSERLSREILAARSLDHTEKATAAASELKRILSPSSSQPNAVEWLLEDSVSV